MTIVTEVFSFLKIVNELQLIVSKGLQRNNYDMTAVYISHPIYQIHFRRFCPIPKQWQNTKRLSVFGKKDFYRFSNFVQTLVNSSYISRTCNWINYVDIWFTKVS